MRKTILSILILALAALTANAQDVFNPTLPGEPNAHYKVTVAISDSKAGTVSSGGSYTEGTQVTIRRTDAYVSASSTTFFKFKCWTLNGEEYTPAGKSSSFTYTVGTQNASFVAVYEEEDPDNITSKVFLTAEPADACTFNASSGSRYLEGNSVYLNCTPTSDAFKFEGWYENGRLISSSRSFNYNVGEDHANLTARFTYEPTIPGEPTSSQDDVDNSTKGDVNNDGTVDVQDVVACVNVVLTDSGNMRADVNKDGVVDVQDVVSLVNIILNKE